METTTFIGLVRDFVAAAMGAALLFGLNITQEQIGGVLLVVTTGLALGTWIYAEHRRRSSDN